MFLMKSDKLTVCSESSQMSMPLQKDKSTREYPFAM